jgi:preprotein translocase subunit Sss1
MTKNLKESTDNGADSPSPNVLKVILAFRTWGWVGFWTQTVLAVIAAVVLLVFVGTRAINGVGAASNPTVANPGTLPGLGFAWVGLAFVCLSIFWNFRYTQLSKKLRSPDRPNRAQTIRQLKIGIAIGLVGMLITLIGAFIIVGWLTAKSQQQPQSIGVIVTTTVQSIDLLVVQANTNIILAHFSGLVTSLWLLNRVADKSSRE